MSPEKTKLFKQFRHSIGAPLRNVEILDEQLDTLLELSVEDYSEIVQNWLIEEQWSSLYGNDITTTDFNFALSVRSFDFATQFTYAYSKQVGLQARGPWELKKDYVTLENGRQVYEIPAGREINEVLWFTPSSMNQALLSTYGGISGGYGLGPAQVGGGIGSGSAVAGYNSGFGGYYLAPAYDVLLAASDINLKNRMAKSELTYKITAGPNGTRLLHLMSTPGSKLTFNREVNNSYISLVGCQVWYYYYDTTPENIDECRRENKDIIKLPNEVPLTELAYEEFNAPTKVLIRQLFFALAKKTLGRTRGKFGGIVGTPNAERTMDFQSLLDEGNKEYGEVVAKINERMTRMTRKEQLNKMADESEALNRHLKYRPLGWYVK